ncbi:MAG: glycoside hydrolase family 3 protein [Spirochaetaceae bacterium]|nr:glycoside hydrolase family 3 protein [Spirochaetaceae bacterium]
MARKKMTRIGRFLFFTATALLVLSCSGKDNPTKDTFNSNNEVSSPQAVAPEESVRTQMDDIIQHRQQEEAIRAFVQSLDPVQRYSQLFLVNLEGSRSFSPVESFQWGNLPEEALLPGGYLFFSYNIAETPSQVAEFNASIQSWSQQRGLVPPLLAVDQEGGMVNRLRSVTSPLPSARQVAQALTASQAQSLYAAQAAQMSLLGFQMNLAPVAEAESQHNSTFLDSRSFGGLGTMEEFAGAAIKGFQSQGLMAVAKHFPGNTNDDPHSGLPEIALEQQELERFYLEPFRRVLQESDPWAVLMSHARISTSGTTASPEQDSETPACLSHFWVTEVLRQRFGYGGLILSDDIFMAALEKNGFPPHKAVMLALEAGVDVIMLSEKRFGSVLRLILDRSQSEPEFAALLDRAVERVVAAKVQAGLLTFRPATKVAAVPVIADTAEVGAASADRLELVPTQRSPWSQEDWDAVYQQGMELYCSVFGGTSE